MSVSSMYAAISFDIFVSTIFITASRACSFVYLHQRFRKENGLAVKSNEVLELDTASRNAITMA